MIESIQYFTAVYRDGRVYLGGKARDAGYYAAELLNQYYLNDAAARVSVYSDNINFNIVRQLENGYLNISEYVVTGRNVLEAVKSLPQLHPFDTTNGGGRFSVRRSIVWNTVNAPLLQNISASVRIVGVPIMLR